MDKSIEFISGIIPPKDRSEPAWWFIFLENKLLIYQKPESITLPFLMNLNELGLRVISQNYLGKLNNHHCYACEAAVGTTPPAGMTFEGLRQVYGRLDEDLFWIAARAVQIVDWDRTHQFCGRCGVQLRMKTTE